ncbi:hypothetical protein ACFVR1_11385 [Psychrobacillus sp. NPDC058041]|uniref:hypothetical protein n=1 Tax=Psychrobacillus sp. NPDC058041 TaxID=3346310 RepID=UPI0036D8A1EF
MFDYTICNQADEKIYNKQCLALEKNIPDIKKGERLIDVDGSEVRTYLLQGSEISVHNDYYINAVYIKSEIELRQYF